MLFGLHAATVFAEDGGITVAQVNIFEGGLQSDRNTAARFARWLVNNHPRTCVIGMQEIKGGEPNAEAIERYIDNELAGPWDHLYFGGDPTDKDPSDDNRTREAIFWRSDRMKFVKNLDVIQVEVTDNGTRWQFGGLLLQKLGTERYLAMFTGKLVKIGGKVNGDGPDRAAEAIKLMNRIETKLENHPNATRVIAIDTNADYRSQAWEKFNNRYADGIRLQGNERPTPTHAWGRLDYVFRDRNPASRRGWNQEKPWNDGFMEGPFVSANFGSDHRAVVARIYLGKKP
jgi:hypothetical protein